MVIYDSMEYTNKMYGILHKSGNYETVSMNEIHIAYRRIHLYLEEFHLDGRITTDTFNFLRVISPVIATVVGIPKIHKYLLDPPLSTSSIR